MADSTTVRTLKRIDTSAIRNYVERLPEVVEEPSIEERSAATLHYMVSVRDELRAARSIELFALDGESFPVIEVGEPRDRRPRFHDYSIIRRVRVRDPEQRARMLDALYGAMRSTGALSFCFKPTYGLRIQANGRTTDLLLAADCDRFYAYVDGVSMPAFLCDLPGEPLEAPLAR